MRQFCQVDTCYDDRQLAIIVKAKMRNQDDTVVLARPPQQQHSEPDKLQGPHSRAVLQARALGQCIVDT